MVEVGKNDGGVGEDKVLYESDKSVIRLYEVPTKGNEPLIAEPNEKDSVEGRVAIPDFVEGSDLERRGDGEALLLVAGA